MSDVSLTGCCACCGGPTGSLFAMGHDARFRGVLARALAAGGWDATVEWHRGAGSSASDHPTVAEALERVALLISRDWREKVELSASRISPAGARRAPSLPRTVPDGQDRAPLPQRAVSTAFEPRNVARERVDALLDRLDGLPLTGQWGWWRPVFEPDQADHAGRRFPARVQATHRSEESELIDLFCPAAFRERITSSLVVAGVDPRQWLRDDDARSA